MAKGIKLDNYQMKRCGDCCICTGGVDNFKRSAVVWTIAFSTIGIGYWAIATFCKKCPTCGHNMFMNTHEHKD